MARKDWTKGTNFVTANVEIPIWQLQRLAATLPQVELETEHFFAEGMYLRKLFQPAGTLIIGKQHKKEHFYIVAKGRVQIEEKVFEAGDVLVSQPGTKRAIVALEDTIYLTVHATKKHNLDKIEKELVEKDATALFDARNELKPKELT